jgi:ATPase family associated with various cellular activities (AAA)
MSNLALKTAVLKKALKTYQKPLTLIVNNARKTTSIPFSAENKDLLEFLHEAIPMSNLQRTKISVWLGGIENLAEIEASSVKEFFKKINPINLATDPTLEIRLANKWYPIMATCTKHKTWTGSDMMDLSVYGQIGGLRFQKSFYIGEWVFTGNDDKPAKRSVADVLSKWDLRITTPAAVAKAKHLASKLMEYKNQRENVVDVYGIGLNYHQWWGWEDIVVGWLNAPTTAIVEPILEDQYAREMDELEDTTWHMPFIRVFSLKHKEYVYVDVEDIKPHVFHPENKSKIVLPSKMMVALDSIFNSNQESLFGDIFHGRHGGIVVLANGPSGVGKTLTAEVFAEFQKRPLYSMEMSEIGTTVKEVEANLQRIFARAKKWNAVLLFDEADIFLSERVASDLERSAIVGIFLRLLDYYEGTFFLTTNRGEGIDKAFRSRVTLYLNYPELSTETRKTIWQHMVKAANLNIAEDIGWDRISSETLNGRQIRNQVRLLKLMYPDGNLNTSDIISSLEFTAR